jgi:hypothetical protein
MRRLMRSLILGVFVSAMMPADAAAQQAISFYLGGLAPRAEDARDIGDVLVADKTFLDFDISNFSSGTVGAEWLVQLGNYVDAGIGLGFYQNTTTAFDRFSVFQFTGEPIKGDLKLRIIPFTATIRLLPFGHDAPVQPYFGLGAGAFRWRYSETGDFVANDGETIVHGSFVGKGAAAGPVILGGVRFPVGPGSVGGEIRYQSATGDLPADQGFAGSTIDLGGFNYLLTFSVGF